jgi:hypothetical protein
MDDAPRAQKRKRGTHNTSLAMAHLASLSICAIFSIYNSSINLNKLIIPYRSSPRPDRRTPRITSYRHLQEKKSLLSQFSRFISLPPGCIILLIIQIGVPQNIFDTSVLWT